MTRAAARVLLYASCLHPLGAEADFASTKPAPRVEYWQRRLETIDAELKDEARLRSVHVVFLGDSITDFWTMGENLWFPRKMCGLEIWNESSSSGRNAGLILGIAGDRTDHVICRILPRRAGGLGELDSPELDPDVVALLVGINNAWAVEKPMADSIFAGIRSVLAAVHERKPRAAVVLESLLPTNDEAKNRDIVRPVNLRLRLLASSASFEGYVTYLDLCGPYVDAAGQQIAADFNDGLHPTEAAYGLWRDRLMPRLEEVRDSTRSTRLGNLVPEAFAAIQQRQRHDAAHAVVGLEGRQVGHAA